MAIQKSQYDILKATNTCAKVNENVADNFLKTKEL